MGLIARQRTEEVSILLVSFTRFHLTTRSSHAGQRQPRNTSSGNLLADASNLDNIFDFNPQKKLADSDIASPIDMSNKSQRPPEFSVTTVVENNIVSEYKNSAYDINGSGLLAQASSKRAGRRGGDSPANPSPSSVSAPNKVKIDDFEDFDLGDMLGLGGDSNIGSKKTSVSAVASKSNDASFNDLPSFLRDTTGRGTTPAPNTSSQGRRGRGGLGVSSPPPATDLFAGVSSQSKNAILSGALDSHFPSKPSILDILDKKTTTAPSATATPKLSIFDILDKKNSQASTPEAKAPTIFDAKKVLAMNTESDDSLSSLALLSDTDEEESAQETPAKQLATNITSDKKKSKKEESEKSRKGDSVTIANLKEQVEKAKDEVEQARNELKTTKEQAEKEKTTLQAELNTKLANEKREQEKTLSDLQKAREEVHNLQKQIDASKIEYEMKLAHEMQQHIQKMSDVMTNAEGVTKLHGLVTQVRDTTEKMEKIQLIVQEATDESLKAREAAVSMKEVHLARIQDELQVSSKQMSQERKKLENLMLDVHDDKKLAELKRQQMEEKLEQEAVKLKNELDMAAKTKDALVFTLNQEKESFRLRTETWNLERARLLEQVNNVIQHLN